MGSYHSSAVAAMTAKDVADYVASIGDDYESYRQVIETNDVNGKKVLSVKRLLAEINRIELDSTSAPASASAPPPASASAIAPASASASASASAIAPSASDSDSTTMPPAPPSPSPLSTAPVDTGGDDVNTTCDSSPKSSNPLVIEIEQTLSHRESQSAADVDAEYAALHALEECIAIEIPSRIKAAEQSAIDAHKAAKEAGEAAQSFAMDNDFSTAKEKKRRQRQTDIHQMLENTNMKCLLSKLNFSKRKMILPLLQ